MITRSFEKYITSLRQKKYREERNRFFAEGEKVVAEFLKESWNVENIIATGEWIENNSVAAERYGDALMEVSEPEMERLSSLVSPSAVMIIAEIAKHEYQDAKVHSQLNLMLDNIQDPGNLGTIIRIADWFGVENIFCSYDCADGFNPKVVQASVGSLARVKVFKCILESVLQKFPSIPVIGTFTEGKNLFELPDISEAFLIIGNEARGVSESLSGFIKTRVAIPRNGKAESLNAAVATGIICSWIRNRIR